MLIEVLIFRRFPTAKPTGRNPRYSLAIPILMLAWALPFAYLVLVLAIGGFLAFKWLKKK
jgi:hypothetical protein